MGVVLSHMGILKETPKARRMLLRMTCKNSQGYDEESLVDVQVPMSLTGHLDRDCIEVRTWFFNKALGHLIADGKDFIYESKEA